MENTPELPGRRRFLAGIITSVQALIGGTLTFVFGGALLSPSIRDRHESWLAAGSLATLPENEPTAVTLRIARQDGYRQVVERQVIFLVKVAEDEVRALSSTCTHLGCRVSWDSSTEQLRCPCHGGVYDRTGAVVAGPPPSPLPTLPTRLDGDQVLVQV
ncbi:MAG: ubiquinol-cytochrome c reductase iron-sulfur subunit [Vicinamibacterales bacterium]